MIEHNLTNDTYYDDTHYMSVSEYKRFLKCEESALLPYEEPTDSMLVGSYVDAFVEGTLDKFKSEHPEIISSQGKTKGQLKAQFKIADDICKKIESDKVFMQFMSGEKQTIMVGKIHGVDWKIKMDSYSPHIAINDLKVMMSITDKNGNYIDFIRKWGYDIQLACYQEIVYQNTGERLPVFICAVTKENPINSVIINIPQINLDFCLLDMKQPLERIMAIKRGELKPTRCEKCKHCISTRKETPIISLNDIS